MSGSGHHDSQPGHALGGKLKDEVRSALKLLFKSAEQHAVALAMEPALTIYSTEIPVESIHVSIQSPDPEVSQDPIRMFNEGAFLVHAAALIHKATLADNAPCAMEPTLCHEPVFDELTFDSHGMSFENLALPSSQPWPIPDMQTRNIRQAIEKIPPPVAQSLPHGGPFTVTSHSVLNTLNKAHAKNDPRFYALPIRKAAIPPHRFSLAAREKFRQALAEKAKTNSANVQLKVVFERMHMALYASIQPDELGHFMCTPKNELLGRNRETASSQAILNQHATERQATYLVVGIRLDSKEELRALVPAHTLPTPDSDEA